MARKFPLHGSVFALCGSGLMCVPAVAAAQASPGHQPAAAAQGGSIGLEEIVVTAQRRSENLQRVPIAVTVATNTELTASGVGGVTDLKMVAPGVEVQANTGFTLPIIRGVASKAVGGGVESPVAIYVDGVYFANPYSNVLTFNNIEQIEVLKGPQGTLFGRNATGGLIQIRTKDPSHQSSGDVSLSLGNYETIVAKGYVTGGLSENLAADIAFSSTAMGKGYGTNFFNGQDVYKTDHDFNVRTKWLLTPADGTEIRFSADYQDQKSSMFAQRIPIGETIPAPYGPSYGGSPWDVDVDVQPLAIVKQGGVSLTVNQELGDLDLLSITAYRESKFHIFFDFDYTRTRGRTQNVPLEDNQFSQEIQIQSNSNSAFTWLIGGYYFSASSIYPTTRLGLLGPAAIPTNPPTIERQNTGGQETESFAGFGQGTLEVVDGLRATVGLRYTTEKRSQVNASTISVFSDGSTEVIIPPINRSDRFNKLTWRFALDYRFSDGVLGYASFNRGFKSGGFNPVVLTVPPYEPEVLDAYEVGLKTELMDRRVRFNVAGYYYDYKNVQVQRVTNNGTGIANGAAATIYGADAELEIQVTPNFDLKFGYQYTHARYDEFLNSVVGTPRPAGGFAMGVGDVSGNVAVLAPESTASAVANYTIPLLNADLDLNLSYYYNSGYYHEPDNVVKEPAYSLINASIYWRGRSGVSFGVWGRNLTNESVAAVNGLASFGATGVARASYAPPRTYGATIGYKF